ncbi:MAG: IS3 family transposase [Nitrososphaera sp.]|nr:IS3 family transposase [Nitrososphaera sp.]
MCRGTLRYRRKKKFWRQGVEKLQIRVRELKLRLSRAVICGIFGRSRQALYKNQMNACKRAYREQIILEAIRDIRRKQPRVGVRKLQRMLARMGFQEGRDHLFTVLRKNRLLIRPKKNYGRTTNSNHRFWKYPNLIKNGTVSRPNEVFVADLTYVRLETGHCYLSLVTDLYSRKIVGWNLSETLELQGSEKALQMALAGVADPTKLIHHSDRGANYCSPRYVKQLESLGARMSMTEEIHVYENAVAERVNGILKNEFIRVKKPRTFRHALKVISEAIATYNEERLHISLNYKTPSECYAA